MDVRPLTTDDFPRLLGLAQQFYDEGKVPGRMVPEKFLGTWHNLYAAGCGVILGLFSGEEIVGALGALTYPDFYDGDTVASEMFWFVNKESRGRGLLLLNEFEVWAKDRGAKRVSMIHLTNLAPDTLRKLYLKRGYREIESHFLKDLN